MGKNFVYTLCFYDTLTVVTLDTSHCISLISLTTEWEKHPLLCQEQDLKQISTVENYIFLIISDFSQLCGRLAVFRGEFWSPSDLKIYI